MAHEPRDVREYTALAGMCLIWGSTFLIIRIGNEAVPPFWAASIRLIIAIPLYLVVAKVAAATLVADGSPCRPGVTEPVSELGAPSRRGPRSTIPMIASKPRTPG